MADDVAGGGDGYHREHGSGLELLADGLGLVHRRVGVGIAVAAEHALDQADGIVGDHETDIDLGRLGIRGVRHIGLQHRLV